MYVNNIVKGERRIRVGFESPTDHLTHQLDELGTQNMDQFRQIRYLVARFIFFAVTIFDRYLENPYSRLIDGVLPIPAA